MGQWTVLFVGTVKGLFRFRSRDRRHWEPAEPDFPGTPVYTTAYELETGTVFAAVNSEFYGPSVRRSRDLGETWDRGGEPPAYGADDPERVSRIWSLLPVPGEPGALLAGVEASGLFRSDDGGDRWVEVASLRGHPTHSLWGAGYGGKCLHRIAVDPFDPDRIYVACSTGGLYRSTDRGETWSPINAGIRADFLPEEQRFPVAGQCVHSFALSSRRPGRAWLQNHGGVYRSDDGGDTWVDVGGGLPSDFGFPVVAHPGRADTAFVVPLVGDGRWPPGARLAVHRTDDAGTTWQAFGEGLPAPVYSAVLRDAFASDGADPLGLYLGTAGGQVFASADEGESWREVAAHLPRILSVKAVSVAA